MATEKDSLMLQKLMIKTWKETYSDYIKTRGEKLISDEIENLFSLDKIISYFKDKNHIIWLVINHHGLAIGYAHLVLFEKSTSAFLQQIYIVKEEQGKGVGKLLLQKCYQHSLKKNYQMIELEVDVNNISAIHFYQKQQFKIVKKIPYNNENYYNYIMQKDMLISQFSFLIWHSKEQKIEPKKRSSLCLIL